MLVQLRAELVSAGVASWRVMDEGDMQAHHFIVERLGALRPGDAILSEEGRDGPARLSADRVWVVDPLDGTNEFGQPGRSDWAVHIALAVRGEPLVGAVALPAVGVVYGTGDPPPYPPPIDGRRLRVITSRSRSSHAAAVVAHSLDADIVTLGSAGAKAMAIVDRRCRHLRALGRAIRMGQRRARGGRDVRRPPRQPPRRIAARSTTARTRGSPISSSAARSCATTCSRRSGADRSEAELGQDFGGVLAERRHSARLGDMIGRRIEAHRGGH